MISDFNTFVHKGCKIAAHFFFFLKNFALLAGFFWHWSYYPHQSRDALSPVCGIFVHILHTLPNFSSFCMPLCLQSNNIYLSCKKIHFYFCVKFYIHCIFFSFLLPFCIFCCQQSHKIYSFWKKMVIENLSTLDRSGSPFSILLTRCFDVNCNLNKLYSNYIFLSSLHPAAGCVGYKYRSNRNLHRHTQVINIYQGILNSHIVKL